MDNAVHAVADWVGVDAVAGGVVEIVVVAIDVTAFHSAGVEEGAYVAMAVSDGRAW